MREYEGSGDSYATKLFAVVSLGCHGTPCPERLARSLGFHVDVFGAAQRLSKGEKAGCGEVICETL